MRKSLLAMAAMLLMPSSAVAQWCGPPIPPLPTSESVAREFREEFKDQFDRYFRAASRYTTCLEDERTRVIEEMRETALRYDRFLNDSARWNNQQTVQESKP
jgi:hypothetical protein